MARHFKRRAKKKLTLAKKVEKIAKQVKLQKPENKYSYVNLTNQQWNYDPTVSYCKDLLTNITAGTSDYNNRIGDQIYVKGITLHGVSYNNLNYPFVARMIIFQLIANPDTVDTTTSIGNLVMESLYTGSANCVNDFFDYDNRKSFRKLYDTSFVINPVGTLYNANTALNQAKIHRHYIKINKKVQFSGGSSNPTANGIYAVFMSDTTASASQFSNLLFKVHYIDA